MKRILKLKIQKLIKDNDKIIYKESLLLKFQNNYLFKIL